MTAQAAYQFLKPSLEELSQKEKEELCRLISGKPEVKEVKRKKKDPVPTEADYRKMLMETWGKKKNKKATRQSGS